MKVLEAMLSINQSIRVSARAIEQEVGVSSAQLLILQCLADEPAQSINDLAANTFTHQSSVSMVVSRLYEKGLVRRSPSDRDARRVSVSLTAPGMSIVRRTPSTAHSRLLGVLKTLSASELKNLRMSLTQVADMIADDGDDEVEVKRRAQRRA
ncbi:MAG TPA: MarR family transcriptional regulator [Gemmatimonadaceae bacterium]|nr:MarR family transcriptional regulator [Gemmatimonadaceae bacterium]